MPLPSTSLHPRPHRSVSSLFAYFSDTFTVTLRTMKILHAIFFVLFWSRNFQLICTETSSLSSALLLLSRLFVSLSSQSPEGVPCYSVFRYLPTMNSGSSDFLLAESGCSYCSCLPRFALCVSVKHLMRQARETECVIFLVQSQQRSLLCFERYYVMANLAFFIFLLLKREVEL